MFHVGTMIRSRPYQHPILPNLTPRDCWSAADVGSVCVRVKCHGCVWRMVLVVLLLVMKDRDENHVFDTFCLMWPSCSGGFLLNKSILNVILSKNGGVKLVCDSFALVNDYILFYPFQIVGRFVKVYIYLDLPKRYII